MIAIRGTVSVKDWMYSLLTPRIVDEFHFGFQLYTEPIWKQLQNILPDLLKDKPKIITTGHSLGGASATLLAHKLNKSDLKPSYSSLETYTFGAPPLGTESVKLETPLYRFRTPGDLVPHLPLLGGCIVEMTSNNLAWLPQVQQPLAEMSKTLTEYSHPEPEYLLHTTGKVYKLDASQMNIQKQQSEFLKILLEKPDHGSAFGEITTNLVKILQFQGNIQSLITESIGGYLGKIAEILLIEHDTLRYIQALDIEKTLPQSLFTKPEFDIKPETQAISLVEKKDMFNKNFLKKIAKGDEQAGEEIVKGTAPASGEIVDMTNLSESVEPVADSQSRDETSTKDSALAVTTDKPQTGNWWDGAFGAVAGAAGAVGNAASAVGGTVAGAAGNVGGAVGGAASAVGGTVVGAAGNVGGAIASAGSAVGGVAGSVGNAVGGAAVATVGAVGGAVGAFTQTVGGAVIGGISSTTSSAGQAIEAVGNNSLIRKAAGIFNADWFLKILDQVDVTASEAEVKRLKQKHPNESAYQIAQRIIGQKAVFAGASGFATSIVPGSAAALFAVDLAATTSLQAEMVYQIACAYGMDLKDPARKGEVVAVFGLAFGGKTAIKAGLGLLRNIPVAGAVIAASSEAVMLYTLGQASCAFYEAKLNPVDFEEKLVDIQKDSEERLKSAIPQEQIIDQILVHVIWAGNQGRSKESVLADLKAANLRPASIDAIAEYMDSPLPLEMLIKDIKPEYALALFAQCQKFAMLDGIMTPEEAKVIEMIHQKFS
ncbi:lipase family protein [Pseudanabaena minima]|uniref:lipase family protein n=1 Tax=Pseudanabaena minima TaxID=890415 RepID=UPI003DA90BB4